MKQVLGDFDRPIEGLFRDNNGTLVVIDDKKLNKYKEQRSIVINKDKRIDELEEKLNFLLKHLEKQ